MVPRPATFRERLSRRRHTALLVAIVVAFAVRPVIGDLRISRVVFSFALCVLLLIALYTVQVDELVGDRAVLLAQRRRRAIIGWVLAVPAIIERVLVFVVPSFDLYLVGTVSWLAFIAFVTWSELRAVLQQREITGETISMAISVYLLLGFTWGLLYVVIFQLQPGAFHLESISNSQPDIVRELPTAFPTFIYFSLTTLATIGFGDITPVSLQARYAAVAEGITGQFYLAILVARLVGMQMSRREQGRSDADRAGRGRE